MRKDPRLLELNMKADVYFSVTVEASAQSQINDLLTKGPFSTAKAVKSENGVSYVSQKVSLNYDDLGETLLVYCTTEDLPDVSAIMPSALAYVQVLIDCESAQGVQMYLSQELMKLLSGNGFGLDIHHN